MGTEAEREAVVRVRGLGTQFGGHWVHRDLDLTLYRGEILALVGETGGGKTTLMREIIGLTRPATGRIEVLGRPVYGGRTAARVQWGVLFQQGALFTSLSVFENIAFPLRELWVSGHELGEDMIHDLVMLKLKMVGLNPEDAWKLPAELSGGMIKRAALARALALEAEVLFLDEPTSGLDPNSASELDRLLDALHRELNLSALMITHDLNSMAAVSDRIAVLAEGRVLITGTLAEVAAYDHPFIRRFFHGVRGEALLRAG
ncbi:sulfate/thiosulfate import ATP-binding protein CysA [bacterium BMS3Bbin12]|nr:sulfate/thiosulfate import ATP-binding protein CysA [bacterium BMS3Abin12]GBE48972.1 sulfate/thiosulfate import ATP-binding protein CysA [bacterium BMS3Bbin12]GBE49303.1 sulfate/thiosulfate import ATP-binding protein CysA [bacterium BMS3Bbin13]HDK03826.1 ATP-binding cassette domain-containing protein [Gammaproteobacteria bacterium]HDO34656.1 ATP-binding cassette domain-containing protein [Chromatiales bacterium]